MLRIPLSSVVFCCVAAQPALGSFIFVSDVGLENRGVFSGSLDYAPTSATSALLTISLTNLSPASNGGFLTAFAFNVSPPGLTVSMVSSGLPGWQSLQAIDASPLPSFDFGASSSSTWQGGGPPSHGIAVGSSSTVTFLVTGAASAMNGLSDMSFFHASRTGYAFAARFRGFNDGLSDKVVGIVPAPGVAAMLLLGGFVRRRSR